MLHLVPKPKKFLNAIDLSTGVYIITLFTIVNKLCGFYGLLAFISGASISTWQLSMYFYSITALVFFCTSLEYISAEDPFRIILFAYGFLFDSVLNAFYTLLFTGSWFLMLSQIDDNGSTSDSLEYAGTLNSSDVTSEGSALPTLTPSSQNENMVPSGTVGLGFMQPESASSLLAICVLWIVRAYFVIAVFSLARKCVRRSKAATDSLTQHPVKATIIALLTRGSYWNGRSRGFDGRKFSHSEDLEDLETRAYLMPDID
ncbi:Inositol phoshorylceramide synthase regulatory subunit kei1 [Neolecta irregularis DAH-3]|uniref:Inositol phoshorylceramide synthase regulatory subunit kei1 n=1 Tax=Neolecta irregularis (strain DAH-3) TaxID=1198029 RepID=A0A1U7LJ32_NEOID|nr:Inositol phoshorylceramide synthase regulatory subunit kei1 [Neolecta irregularis DAH-3]|eukprot:OLL22654.1 Inositol phoshorylceramide synthase regulatory subunit kei1 [Neolecta irregularis DAH-3]